MADFFIRSASFLSRATFAAASVLLVLLIALTTYEVVARYVFLAPTIWGLEVSELINAALFLLAAPFVMLMKGNVVIDILSTRMRPRVSTWISLLFHLFLLLPSIALIAGFAAREAWKSYASGARSLSAWQAPVWTPEALIFIGFALLSLQIVAEILKMYFEQKR